MLITLLTQKFNSVFNIMHLNCRSMFNKINEIESLALTSKATIVALTETWLDQDIAKLVKINNFNFEHISRKMNAEEEEWDFLYTIL